MNDPVSGSMQVAILASSFSNMPEYAKITASINTMEGDEAYWNYLSMTFIQDQKSHKSYCRSVKGMNMNVGTLATPTNTNGTRHNKSGRKKGATRCYSGETLRYIA